MFNNCLSYGFMHSGFVNREHFSRLERHFNLMIMEDSAVSIESSMWNQMERNLKGFGFREGAVKGRESSFQNGFDEGYLHGFEMGEQLGFVKGCVSCLKQLDENKVSSLSTEKLAVLENASKGSCILCVQPELGVKVPLDDELYSQDLEDIALKQKDHNISVLKSLQAVRNQIEVSEKG